MLCAAGLRPRLLRPSTGWHSSCSDRPWAATQVLFSGSNTLFWVKSGTQRNMFPTLCVLSRGRPQPTCRRVSPPRTYLEEEGAEHFCWSEQDGKYCQESNSAPCPNLQLLEHVPQGKVKGAAVFGCGNPEPGEKKSFPKRLDFELQLFICFVYFKRTKLMIIMQNVYFSKCLPFFSPPSS